MGKETSLEERRLALEEQTAQQNFELKKIELDLKRNESTWPARVFTPLTTTIFAGILTLAASVTGSLMQGQSTLQLEREKFESTRKLERQKGQQELLLKMVSVGNEQQARANLRFLAETRLLDEQLSAHILTLKPEQIPVLPSTGTPEEAHSAARRGDPAMIKRLLDGGWKPDNPVDKEGDTMAHLAAEYCSPEALRTLKDHGATLDIVNKWGDTPEVIARARCSRTLAEEIKVIIQSSKK